MLSAVHLCNCVNSFCCRLRHEHRAVTNINTTKTKYYQMLMDDDDDYDDDDVHIVQYAKIVIHTALKP